jgi:hypothetical protein
MSESGRSAVPKGAQLKAASILAFCMFFLALRGHSPYSARRAWLAGREAGICACTT